MNKLEVFDSIKDTAHLGGGEEKITMQHNLNKLTARERVLALLDEGSFVEVGSLISKDGAGVIAGHGTVDGRLVFIYSNDYTVEGGTFTKTMGKKIVNLLESAAKIGAPVIQVIDSIGGKLTEGVELLGAYGSVLKSFGKLSGVVPRISVVCGPSNGIMSVLATMGDITVTVNDLSDLSVSSISSLISQEKKFINGEMATNGEKSNKNGNAHINVKDEDEAFEVVRRLVSYLPSNNLEMPCVFEEDVALNLAKENLNSMVESGEYSIDEILNTIADSNSVIEIFEGFAMNFKTVLAKINGLTTGIIMNSGDKTIDNAGSQKVASFVKLCDSFNISILSIVDTKGAIVSVEEESKGLANNISRVMYALINASVPKVSLIVGEACGLGYELLASKETAFDVCMAWPGAKICLTTPEAYIKGLYSEEIFETADPKQGEKDVVEKYFDEVTSPYEAANYGMIDDIIRPGESKQRIFAMLDMLQSKRELKYPKSHGTTLI